MDKISIIVPIYNIEQFLPECIESLINQTYHNFEIILVNDGSIDGSRAICERYALIDGRIRVINQENAGLSAALNTGLIHAEGDWILFVDGDDYIFPDTIEFNLTLAKEQGAQIVQFDFETNDGAAENNLDVVSWNENGISSLYYLFNKKSPLYKNTQLVTSIRWNKLYSKKLFENITFPTGRIHEDEYCVYKLFYLADKVVFTNKVCYHYRIREGSIMTSSFSSKRLDKLYAFEERALFLKKINQTNLFKLAITKYYQLLIQLYSQCNYNDTEDMSKTKILLEKYAKKNVCYFPYLSGLVKIEVILFIAAPGMVGKIVWKRMKKREK